MSKEDIIRFLFEIDAVKKYGWDWLRTFNKEQQEDLEAEVWKNICEAKDSIFEKLGKQKEENVTAYFKRFIFQQLSPRGDTRWLQKIYNENNLRFEECFNYDEDGDNDNN